jgi:hypothetical protein
MIGALGKQWSRGANLWAHHGNSLDRCGFAWFWYDGYDAYWEKPLPKISTMLDRWYTGICFGGLMGPLTEVGKPELDQTYEVQ